jgi:hypothetical protein
MQRSAMTRTTASTRTGSTAHTMPIRKIPQPPAREPRVDPRLDPRVPIMTLPNVRVNLPRFDWFKPLPPDVVVPPGKVSPQLLRVPERDAERVLLAVIHLVADIRKEQPPNVVWTLGNDELHVLLDKTRLSCGPGIITIGLTVQCEEARGPQRMDVGFAVGRPDRPTGLIMSTFDRVQGNLAIANTWSESLTAFAWEAVVTMAEELSGGMGKDSRGRALVPGSIAADKGAIFIDPMARHDLRWVASK